MKVGQWCRILPGNSGLDSFTVRFRYCGLMCIIIETMEFEKLVVVEIPSMDWLLTLYSSSLMVCHD